MRARVLAALLLPAAAAARPFPVGLAGTGSPRVAAEAERLGLAVVSTAPAGAATVLCGAERMRDFTELRFESARAVAGGAAGVFFAPPAVPAGRDLLDYPEEWQALARAARELTAMRAVLEDGLQAPRPAGLPAGVTVRSWTLGARRYALLVNASGAEAAVDAAVLAPWRALFAARADARESLVPCGASRCLQAGGVLWLEGRPAWTPDAETPEAGLFGMTVSGDFKAAAAGARASGFATAVISAEKEHLDALGALGMKGLVAFWLDGETSRDPKKWEAFLARVSRDVARLKGHPAVGAWYLADEPDGESVPVEKIATLAALVRSLDAKTPLMAVFDKPGRWAPYLPYFDIVAVDPYLRRREDGTYDAPAVAGEWTARAVRDAAAAGPGKRVWTVLGAFEERPKDASKSPGYRKPTPAEFRAMAADARRAGADGLLVYSYCFAESADSRGWRLREDDPALWDAVKELGRRAP